MDKQNRLILIDGSGYIFRAYYALPPMHRKDGIPVNAVCPGTIESPMMGRIETELSRRAGVANTSFIPQIPMGRYGYPEEVASLVAYLLLDAPVYISGTTLVVDGALYA